MEIITFASTSNVIRVKILDSASTTGAGKTGLTFSSAGLIVSTIADNESSATTYTQAGSTIETITTLGTFAAPTATKCRLKEVDATNHPGVYELQIADARFAVSSAKRLLISISGVTGIVQLDKVVELKRVDLQDGVRGGLTSIPNVASGSAGALLVDGTGTAAISNSAGKVLLQATQSGVTIPTVTTVTNGVTVTTNNDKTGYSLANGSIVTATFGTCDFTGTMKTSLNAATPASVTGAVGSVTAGVTVATNNDKTGYSLTQSFPANFSSLGISVGGAITTVTTTTNLTTLPSIPANWITAAGIASGALTSVWTYSLPGSYTAGQAGYILGHLGAGADPWSTPLPGSYTAGEAGNILGNFSAGAGPSAAPCTVTIKDNSNNPIVDASVWIKSGTTLVAGVLFTDSSGNAHTLLVPGATYLLYATGEGINPINGQSFAAVAD